MAALNLNKDNLIKLSVRNSFYSSIGSIATLAVSVFVAGYSIRILGEGLAGFVMLMQTIVGVSSSLTDFGFGTSVVKAISEAYAVNDKKRIINTIKATSFFNFIIAFILSIIIAVFSYNVVEWARVSQNYFSEAKTSIYFYLLAFLINTSTSSYKALPSALQKFEYASIINVFQAISTGLIQMFVLIYYPTILNLSIGLFIASILQLILALIISSKLLGKLIIPMSNWKVVKELFGYSTIVFINSLVYQLRNYADRWILTSLSGAVVLPGYVVGQTLTQKIQGLFSSPFYFLFPMLSSSSVQMDKKKVFKIYSNFHWFVSMMGTFIFIFAAANSFWLLELWIKKGFAIKYNYLFIMACFQGVFGSFSVVPHFSSFGLGKPSNNLWEATVTTSVILLLAFAFIPIWGVTGAAIAQLAAYLVAILFIQIQMKKTIFNDFTLWDLFKPILPSTLVGISAFSILLYFSLHNIFLELSIVQIIEMNFAVVFVLCLVILFEKYINNNSGRYQVVSEAVVMMRGKVFA